MCDRDPAGTGAHAEPPPRERIDEFTHRVSGEAIVEMQRGCVPAGDPGDEQGAARAGTGTHVRESGRASHRPSTDPGPSAPHPREQRPVGSITPAIPDPVESRSPHRRSRGSSGTPLCRAPSSRGRARCLGPAPAEHVAVVRVHPQLAAGALHDRCRLTVVIRVGVRADEQAHVLEAEVAHRERPVRAAPATPAGACRYRTARCRPRSDGPGVAVRNPRPGQRQAQAKDAREHTFTPPQLLLDGRLVRDCARS